MVNRRRIDYAIAKRKRKKRQTMIYITFHRKLKIDKLTKTQITEKSWVDSNGPEEQATPVPLVARVMLPDDR